MKSGRKGPLFLSKGKTDQGTSLSFYRQLRCSQTSPNISSFGGVFESPSGQHCPDEPSAFRRRARLRKARPPPRAPKFSSSSSSLHTPHATRFPAANATFYYTFFALPRQHKVCRAARQKDEVLLSQRYPVWALRESP